VDRARHSLERALLGGLVYVGKLMQIRLVFARNGDAALVGLIFVRLRRAVVCAICCAGTDKHHHGDRHC
jgi:hypothetical protein